MENSTETEYLRRRSEREAVAQACRRRDLTVSRARTAVALAALLLGWLAFGPQQVSGWWLAAPAIVFVVLMALHERVLQVKSRAERAVEYYDAGLRRLEHRWIGRGVTGTDFAHSDHPYAADLDLFGRGSLFDLICRAGTRNGQECLAGWLTAAADVTTLRRRHAAVEDLRGRLDFREALALVAAMTEVEGPALERWGEAPIPPPPTWERLAAVALALAGVASLLAWWPFGAGPYPFVAVLAIGQLQLQHLRGRVAPALRGVDRSADALDALSDLLAIVEREPFASPMLAGLKEELAVDGTPPSAQIRRLRAMLNWLSLQESILFAPPARVLLWRVHFAFAFEGWRRTNGAKLRLWLRVIGEMEALSSLATHAFEHAEDPFPELVEERPCFSAEGLGHPLLPAAATVHNDVTLDAETRLLVVSGSNMSGKSTLLRTVGVNTVLALAGAPVRATRLRLSPLKIGASLRSQDSLQGGISRFYAEIVRLRQIVALADDPPPLLFLLDEILHGTNSHDRLIGAEAIATTLVRRGGIGLITTHDLALARIGARADLHAVNVHFEDRLVDGKVTFDYRLQPGVVTKSNALDLMRAIGLDV
jgi:hypothetical protein